MAGGEGSRLRPLTCDCPKPMLRLMGRPLMEYALRLLERHGICEIAATLGYLSDAILDYFGEDAPMKFYIEQAPLGTAGSVKQAQDFLNERFIVLSGDGITDIDLSAAARFHAERGALATLVLKQSASPQEYGMVVTDARGRIRAFHEKPARSDVYSDRINTGIYILEPEILNYIPEGAPCDFGHGLFPALLEKDLPIYGYTAQGYWCDVGDVAAYLQVHADALDGKIDLPALAPSIDGAILEAGCSVESPVFIAPNAHIAAGAHIGAYSVIGEGCFIAGGAGVKRSLLLDGARIEPNAQLRGCIVGKSAVVGAHAQLFEESVVGSRSRIGERASLPPGVKLWPEKALPEGERPEENIVWGSLRAERFIAGAIQIESPAQSARAAQACMAQLQPREVVIGRSDSTVAAALWHAAASGAMAQGAQVIDAGACTLGQLKHTLKSLHADAALLVEEDRLLPIAAGGAYLSEKLQRGVLKLMERQDFPSPFSRITRPILHAEGSAAYIADAAAHFCADPACAPEIRICADRPLTAEIAQRCFRRAGLRTSCAMDGEPLHLSAGEMGVYLPQRGEIARISDAQGTLDEAQRQLACAWTLLESGHRRLILPNHFTRSIDDLAARYAAHAVYLSGERSAWMRALAENAPEQLELHQDGVRFALRFLSLLVDRGLSLEQWRRQAPESHRSTRNVPIPAREGGRLLHALAQACPDAQLGGGVRLPRKNGWAWLGPDEGGAQLNIIAESADMETAREICDFYSDEIQRLMRRQD